MRFSVASNSWQTSFDGKWREENRSTTTIEELHNTRELVAKLIKWLESKSIQERFQGIDEDVLGAYFFRKGNIQIYWMAIYLIARILDVSVEGLTIAVLAHELVHAYTHVGSDIDGEQWATNAFELQKPIPLEALRTIT